MSGAASTKSIGAALVVVAGTVASGKSAVSRALAERIGAERLEADRVRGTLLAAAEPGLSGSEARWRRDFAPGFEDEVYADLLQRAGEVLASGRPLVLDACFPRRAQREAARALAHRFGVPFLFVECQVEESTILARLAARDEAARRAAEPGRTGWGEIHRRLADHFESPEELDARRERLVVHSDGPTGTVVEQIVARLGESGGAPVTESSAPALPLPRAVSFDCWNTLLVEQDWPWAHEQRVSALADAAREAGSEIERAAVGRAFDAAWGRNHEAWMAGRATGAREVAEWGLAELGLDAPRPVLEKLVRRFEEASHTSHVVAVEGAISLLGALSHMGVARVLVSDTGLTPGRIVRRLLDHAGLLGGLDVLSFSDEVGAPKPDPRAFLAALEPLGVEPRDALHVGDLRRTDVAGARALGMRSARIRTHHDDREDLPDADHVVESHAELAALLGVPLSGA